MFNVWEEPKMSDKVQYYVQVRLKKPNLKDGGSQHLVTWTKEKHAEVGKKVKVKMGDGSWSLGWTVVDCWDRLTKEEVMERKNYYRTQRQASDI